MADKEKKTAVEPKDKAPKTEKDKEDKPSLWTRLGNWFKSVRSECKKICWAGWNTVRQNSIIVIVCVLICSAVLGILDYTFSQAIRGLARLI